MWVWALSVAGAVTVYEVYFNNDSGEFPSKFWSDRVPFYFTMTLAFTGITLGLSTLSPRFEGWLGILVSSIAVSISFAVLVPGGADWWLRLLLARNVVLLTTIYLVPPYLMATLIRWRAPASD
jgi:hypothetical protein